MGMFRGGGEQFDLNIAKELKNLGCNVSFVVGKPLFYRVRYPVEEFPTDYLASPYMRDFSQRLEILPFPVRQMSHRLFHFDLWAFSKKAMISLSRNDDYDLIQTCGISSLVKLKEMKKIPIIIYYPGPPDFKDKELISKFDAVISHGQALAFIRKYFREDAIDIPPGVDFDLFSPVKSDLRESYSVNTNEKLLLFVGRLVPLKNLLFLIRTFAEVVRERNNVKLLIVGEGPLERQTRAWVRKLKVEEHVILMGKVPNEQLPQYYSAANIFVISSYYETFSIVISEAMSCELPVVATRVGGIPMQIKEGKNGFLVESGNVEQFKEKIIFLLDNEFLAEEIGKRNRQKVKEKYSWLESAKKLKAIYDSLL